MPVQPSMRVIIVDDNNLIRSILGALLRDEGFDVVAEQANAGELASLIQRHRPDILCLDHNLPDARGLDLLGSLHRSHPELAIVMITGTQDPDLQKQAASAGAAGFLHKPFSQDQVVRELRQIRHAKTLLRTSLKTLQTQPAGSLDILLADDSATQRQLLSAILSEAGMQVVGEANDGQQTLDLAQALQPQLIFLDVEMPGLNGLKTLELLKQGRSKAHVVMVTSRTDSLTVKTALAGGACGYIIKPYQVKQIHALLERMLNLS